MRLKFSINQLQKDFCKGLIRYRIYAALYYESRRAFRLAKMSIFPCGFRGKNAQWSGSEGAKLILAPRERTP